MRGSAVLAIVAILGLLAGCATQEAGIGGAVSPDAVAAPAAARDLDGRWRGSFSQVGGGIDGDQADCVLQVKEDSTFTAKCTRSEPAPNAGPKVSAWSGRVVTKERRVILETTEGAWPSMTLTRSADDRLYAMTRDPLVQVFVLFEFERDVNAP